VITSPTVITRQQVEQYREEGYLVVAGLLDPELVAGLQSATDSFIEESRKRTESTDALELGTGHSAESPYVRRIKSPHKHHPAYRRAIMEGKVVDVLTQLIGPDIRLHGSKLNLKMASKGDPVEWHQDWAFLPHTNDDVCAVGIAIDDVTDENGPLNVLPGSHKGPIFDHHYEGRFGGGIDPDTPGIDFSSAAPMKGPAGTVTFHHVRAVHGSAPNLSTRPRRMIFANYAAVDAWPLVGCGGPGAGAGNCPGANWDEFNARIVTGSPTTIVRMTAVPVRLPLPGAEDNRSVFTVQEKAGARYWNRQQSHM
jgi:ectoine hydroxylase-related dioxygenase (phytanoyl-CoA dioxygenase family)